MYLMASPIFGISTYEGYFNKWILPGWGSSRVTDVKAVAVEQWVDSMSYANGSKAKARSIMSAMAITPSGRNGLM